MTCHRQDLQDELKRCGLKKTDLKLTGEAPLYLDTVNSDVDRVGRSQDNLPPQTSSKLKFTYV